MVYKVEGFEIEPDPGQLTAAGSPVPLRHKTLQLLLYLLENRDRVIGRDELLREVWQGAAVSKNSVAQCIIELRRALGDDARDPRFIRTFGREGYRFVGPLTEVASPLAEGTREHLLATEVGNAVAAVPVPSLFRPGAATGSAAPWPSYLSSPLALRFGPPSHPLPGGQPPQSR